MPSRSTTCTSECYRQKAVVGGAAKHVVDVVAASSPFADDQKRKRYASDRLALTSLSNDVEFVNPDGVVRTYMRATNLVLASHIDWLLGRQVQMWRHSPPVLVAVDERLNLPPSTLREFDRLRQGLGATSGGKSMVDQVELRDVWEVKGLKYQHCVLALGSQLQSSLNDGFHGVGNAEYNSFRLLRIPFSRAKDSLATFVFR